MGVLGIVAQNSKREDQEELVHVEVIQKLADGLLKLNYDVRADHIDWFNGPPPNINGHIPDVLATGEDEKFIIEVETASTYFEEYTQKELKSFAEEPAVCWIIVPKHCAASNANAQDPVRKIKMLLAKWGLAEKVKVGMFNPLTREVV